MKSYNNHLNRPLQHALFKAAKVGNLNLMRELIEAGADPFASDENGITIISYAYIAAPEATKTLLQELELQHSFIDRG